MKLLIISIPLIISLILGYKNFFAIKKTIVYSALAVFALALVYLTCSPELSTNLRSAAYLIENKYEGDIPVQIDEHSTAQLKKNGIIHYSNKKFTAKEKDFNPGDILYFSRSGDSSVKLSEVRTNSNILTFSFIPGIENYIRLFPLHVAFAWVGLLGFVLSLFFSFRFLFSNSINYASNSFIAAKLGFIFTLVATVLGMIWAKHSWGSYWNWDPRQISIIILLSIYVSYFILRSSIDNEHKKAKLSSVYAIFAGLSAPFFVFIMPRISNGLHPGASNDSASPIIGVSKTSMMNMDLLIVFSLSLCFFTLLFFLIYHKNVENYLMKLKNNNTSEITD